jgi:NAD(P)H-dependent FMN reductase
LVDKGLCVNEKTSVQVLAICGALREGSFNFMATRAAIAMAPKQMRFVEAASPTYLFTMKMFV